MQIFISFQTGMFLICTAKKLRLLQTNKPNCNAELFSKELNVQVCDARKDNKSI